MSEAKRADTDGELKKKKKDHQQIKSQSWTRNFESTLLIAADPQFNSWLPNSQTYVLNRWATEPGRQTILWDLKNSLNYYIHSNELPYYKHHMMFITYMFFNPFSNHFSKWLLLFSFNRGENLKFRNLKTKSRHCFYNLSLWVPSSALVMTTSLERTTFLGENDSLGLWWRR